MSTTHGSSLLDFIGGLASLGSRFSHGDQITHLITKETCRPVGNVSVEVHGERLEIGPPHTVLAEIQGNLVLAQPLFGNTALQAAEEVLRMALDNELHPPVHTVFAGVNGFYEKIGHLRLHRRVKVKFGLLHQDGRLRRCIEATDDDREDLRDTKSNIGEVHLFFAALRFHNDLILLPVLRYGTRLE